MRAKVEGQGGALQYGFNSLATSGVGWGQGGIVLVSIGFGQLEQAAKNRQEIIRNIRISNSFLLHKFFYKWYSSYH